MLLRIVAAACLAVLAAEVRTGGRRLPHTNWEAGDPRECGGFTSKMARSRGTMMVEWASKDPRKLYGDPGIMFHYERGTKTREMFMEIHWDKSHEFCRERLLDRLCRTDRDMRLEGVKESLHHGRRLYRYHCVVFPGQDPGDYHQDFFVLMLKGRGCLHFHEEMSMWKSRCTSKVVDSVLRSLRPIDKDAASDVEGDAGLAPPQL